MLRHLRARRQSWRASRAHTSSCTNARRKCADVSNLHTRRQQNYRTLALRAAPPHTLVSEIFLVRLLDGIPHTCSARQWTSEKKNRVVKQTVSCKTCKEGRPASACTGPGRGGAVGVILTHDRGASRRRSTSGIRVCALSPAFARPLSRYRFLLRRVRFGRHTTDALGTHPRTRAHAAARSSRPHILRARAGRLKRLSWRHNAASADQPAGGMRAALCLARRRRLRPLCVCAGGWPGSGCEASRWNMPTASAPHHHACGEARPGGHAGDDGKEEDD